ncbi:MAG TPA: universal stress protein [Myxococcaceae bacterium]|nr:universal stress protein [Myxococcaceae bacterium]
MKRIIAAIDGSHASQDALRSAVQFALAFGAHLTIVNVIPTFKEEAELESFGDFDHALEERAAKLVTDAAAMVDLPPERVDTRVLRGTPAEAVADAAQASDVDLVVVGNRGRNPVTRVLLGSVSDRLVHVCTKPVMVVR